MQRSLFLNKLKICLTSIYTSLKKRKITRFFYYLFNVERLFKFFCFEFINLSDIWGMLHEIDNINDIRKHVILADWIVGEENFESFI
jgi:hypothetical protein